MSDKVRALILAAAVFVLALPCQSTLADSSVDKNRIYGMHFGFALLMDVHYPRNPNGYGIIFIPGSGWSAPMSPDAEPLKDTISRSHYGAEQLLNAGYTLFAINHRASPEYTYPDPVHDAQRALRYIRFHASEFNINADRIGAFGGSSGGHLALMLAFADGTGDPNDLSAINRESAKVQTVVALNAPTDFIAGALEGHSRPPLFREQLPRSQLRSEPDSLEVRLFKEASPVSYVSPDDPPVLLIHGDNDKVVPYSQSVILADAAREAGIETKLITVPGGGHGRGILSGPDTPNYVDSTVDWFNRYLIEQ